MDREAWRATVHRVTRVGHDLEIKPPPIIVHLGCFPILALIRSTLNSLIHQNIGHNFSYFKGDSERWNFGVKSPTLKSSFH